MYTRQDLRLICELIESDLNRHTRYSQSSNGQWIAQDYTYTSKEVVEIIRKHLLLKPTEEELQGVINAVKKAYTPDDVQDNITDGMFASKAYKED